MAEMEDAEDSVVEIDKEMSKPDTSEQKKEELKEERNTQLDNIDAAADKKPESTKIQRKATEAFLKVNEPERALTRAEQWVKLAPDDPRAVRTRGRVFYKMGDYGSAERDARRALKMDPNDRQAFALLKLTEGRSGTRDSAGGYSSPSVDLPSPAAQESDPEPWEGLEDAERTARNIRAIKYLKQSRRKAALGDLRAAYALAAKAVATDPEEAQAYLAVAKLSMKLDNLQGAREAAQSAANLDPTSGSAFLIMAQASEALGSFQDKVLKLYERAASVEPDLEPFYREALERYAAKSRRGTFALSSDGASSENPANTFGKKRRYLPFLGPMDWRTAVAWLFGGTALLIFIAWYFFGHRRHRHRVKSGI